MYRFLANTMTIILLLSSVLVYSQTRTSIATGRWDRNGTWDCSCVPAAGDDVVIANGHSVTLRNNTTIQHLTIDAGATLVDNKKTMIVTGNLFINGTYDGAKDLTLFGTNTSISGVGSKSGRGDIVISGGNKTILAGTDLSLTQGGVSIAAGVNLVNNGTVTVDKDVSGPGTWVNSTNSTLNAGNKVMAAGGALDCDASGNTVNYYSAMGQAVFAPTTGYANLDLSGTGVKTLSAATVVNEALNITSGELDMNNFNLNIGGDFMNSGTLIQTTETVAFDGSGDQKITSSGGQTFYNMTVEKLGGSLVLNHDVVVSNTLIFSSGVVDATVGKLTLGTSTAAVGNYVYTSGTVVGSFERWLAGPGSLSFPVGTLSDTRVANITANTVATGGSLIASFKSLSPGNVGLPLEDVNDSIFNSFVEGYWTLTQSNLLDITNYDLSLTGTNFITFPINGSTRLLSRDNSSGNWITDGTHVPAAGSTAGRSGMTTISAEYAFGDTTNCKAPVTSVITGNNSVCASVTGEAYSVANSPGSTYSWTITGGLQASGTNTNSITVDWGSTGMVGEVQVVENNGCSNGAPKTFNVTLNSLPTSPISGKSSAPENATNESYSVESMAGYSYTWSVTGGSIMAGQNTNSISVTWGSAGVGQVCVTATSVCNSADPVCLDVNIYVVVNSVATGRWDSNATWDCSCVPDKTDNVRINNTHTVELRAREEIANLIIDGGATLFDNGNRMTVTGDFDVDGTYTGTSDLRLEGENISGNGTITNTGDLSMRNQAKYILAGSTFNKSVGDIEIRSGINVFNNGQVSCAGDVLGQDATASWTNQENSSFTIGGILLATGFYYATSEGNTTEFNGTVTQNPTTTDFYNLNVTGIGGMNLSGESSVGGDVIIGSLGTLNTGGFNVSVSGNWTNDGGTYSVGAETIRFEGATVQTIGGLKGAETFGNVVINSGSVVNVSANTTVTISAALVNNGTLDNDGHVKIPNGFSSGSLSGSGVHELTGGNWSSQGSFTAENSKVLFSSGTAQTISGATTFNDIETTNASGVSISSGAQNLKGTLTISAGAFSTGDLLTLVSTASQTGRIASITGGASISGNITAQRFESGPESWRLISAPAVSSIADWQGEFWTSGYTGATYENYYGFVSIYTHDETALGDYSRYNYATGSGMSINPGDGYLVWIGGWPIGNTYEGTIDVTGPVFSGPLVKNVTHTTLDDGVDGDGNPVDYDGWNLVANPYPSDIDLSGLTLSNVDNFVYVFDPAVGDYVSKSCSGGDIIAQHQAFFVKASSAGSVTFNETAKTAGNTEFFRQAAEKELTLYLEGNGYNHDVRVRFNNDATFQYDGLFDAYQPKSLDYSAPYLATFSSDEDLLDINTIPDSVGEYTIPLMVKAGPGMSGSYTISVDGIDNFEDRPCLFLEDLVENTTIDLKKTTSYAFSLSDVVSGPRFLLHLGGKISASSESVSCNSGEDGKVIVNTAGNGPWDIVWKDQSGNVIATDNNIADTFITLDNVTPGNYYAEITNNDGSCGVGKVYSNVIEPTAITTSIEMERVDCNGSATGEITMDSFGGTGNHSYLWNTGATQANIKGLSAGVYIVTVKDDNNCEYQFEQHVNEPFELEVTDIIVEPTCFESANGNAAINVFGGNYPFYYTWSNGSSTSSVYGLIEGTHYCSVTDSKGCQTSTAISIPEVNEIVPDFTLSAETIYLSEGGLVEFANTSQGANTYDWNFGNGILSTLASPSYVYTETGTYLVELIANNGKCSEAIQKTVEVKEAKDITGLINEHLQDIVVSKLNNKKVLITNSKNGYYNLTLYNSIGQEVYIKNSINTSTEEIDISKFNSGVYVIKIQPKDGKLKSIKVSK